MAHGTGLVRDGMNVRMRLQRTVGCPLLVAGVDLEDVFASRERARRIDKEVHRPRRRVFCDDAPGAPDRILRRQPQLLDAH